VLPATWQGPIGATSRQNSEENHSISVADAEPVVEEWQDIRNAFGILEECFGIDFAPLGPELVARTATPFGPALQYRTYGIAGIWLNYYMGLIVAYRAHPTMPPAALMASGIAARQTSHFAHAIGCITAGISPDLSQQTEVNSSLAAVLIESCLALFVAGIQVRVSRTVRC
jgi:hypothetical protein